jgi:hypothetical protein
MRIDLTNTYDKVNDNFLLGLIIGCHQPQFVFSFW